MMYRNINISIKLYVIAFAELGDHAKIHTDKYITVLTKVQSKLFRKN